MSNDFEHEETWPPLGWDSLLKHKKRTGQSLTKDANTAKVRGLTYKITSDPLHIKDRSFYIHHVRINAWEYTIQNDSNEFPVLRLKIMDRFDENIPEIFYISGIKAMSCPVILNERSARRTVQLMRFLLAQIERGYVPDIDRSMRMYRLHPLQLHAQREADKVVENWPVNVVGSGKANNIKYYE
jgi:hypothetical protein